MLDLAIRNAEVVDGTGAPRRRGDVAVRDGRIVGVGKVDDSARQEIDATDLVVAPGFIDIHTHYDAQAFWDTTLSPSPLHGVTTVVGGNCGFSIAPLTASMADYVMRMLARVEGMPLDALMAGVPWDWSSTADFMGRLDGALAPNTGWMVGHSAIRCVVMGEDAVDSEASPEQLTAMQSLLREGLEAGALGFSSTWSTTHNDHQGRPVPSRRADRSELLALCSVVASVEGTTVEFIPAAGRFDESVFELMASMSRAAQRPLNWNSLMVDPGNEEFVEHQLSAADFASARGGRVVALAPADTRHHRVNFQSGFIFDGFPGWDVIMALPPAEKLAVLQDPVQRGRMEELARQADGGYLKTAADWPGYVIVETFSERFRRFTGRTVDELARQLGMTPFDALIEVVVADELRTVVMKEDVGQDEETWKRRVDLWRDPRAMVGASDAGAHVDMTDAFSYGTTLLQKAVRERELLALEEGVQMLTSQPAALYGLRDRGVVTEGAHADLTVFDPASVGAGPVTTRFDFPGGAGRLYGSGRGIEHVIVGGTEIVRGSEFTEARPGRVLHSGQDTFTVPVPRVRPS